MVLSFSLHQLVTCDVQLSFLLLVWSGWVRVSTFKSQVVVLPQNKVACCVQMRGEQLYKVKEWEYLGVTVEYECQRSQEANRCCSSCNVGVMVEGGSKEGASNARLSSSACAEAEGCVQKREIVATCSRNAVSPGICASWFLWEQPAWVMCLGRMPRKPRHLLRPGVRRKKARWLYFTTDLATSQDPRGVAGGSYLVKVSPVCHIHLNLTAAQKRSSSCRKRLSEL